MKDGTDPHEGTSSDTRSRPAQGPGQPTAVLRILATTDIHMQLTGHDYVRDQSVGHSGLAGLASLIKAAREEAAVQQIPCLLVDNGDMLQGSAIGDALAETPVTKDHPLLASLDAMKYDCVGVGNHDLDHGMPYLQRLAALAPAPFISTNLEWEGDSAVCTAALVKRPCTNGTPAELTIGFLSVLPLDTGIWNKPMLEGNAKIKPAREALADAIPRLRDQGADIVILLAHMGIEEDDTAVDARTLAALPGVDAIITGHTHRRLPGLDHAGLSNVDINKGSLGPCPAVMPGFNASDLAVLDLGLTQTKDGKWQVADHKVTLRSNSSDVPPEDKVAQIVAPAHQSTLAALAEPVGKSAAPLHNFFSLAMPTPTCALTASAKHLIVGSELRDTPYASLPLLSAASAHTAGGRGGPDHFINISPGTIYRRALAGLSPYSNAITALHITGAELRAWLEHTVGIYNQLRPDKSMQPLLREKRPTFHFDTIYGVHYGVDPMRPTGKRITSLSYCGTPVKENHEFILATNKFRAAGGGGGQQFSADRIVFQSEISLADGLLATLKSKERAYPSDSTPWYFDCSKPARAVLKTSSQAVRYLEDIAHLAPVPMMKDMHGFMPLRLTLGHLR